MKFLQIAQCLSVVAADVTNAETGSVLQTKASFAEEPDLGHGPIVHAVNDHTPVKDNTPAPKQDEQDSKGGGLVEIANDDGDDAVNQWQEECEDCPANAVLLARKSSQFAELLLVQQEDGSKVFYINGETQSSTADEQVYHSLLVHPATTALNSGAHVVVIGGGEGATLREVLKSDKVSRVTMVDIDEELINFAKENLRDMHQDSFASPKALVLFQDGAEFLRSLDNASVDAIIVDGVDIEDDVALIAGESEDTEPETRLEQAGASLYSKDFYRDAYRALRPEGVFTQYMSNVNRTAQLQDVGFSNVTGYATRIPSFQGGGASFLIAFKSVGNDDAAASVLSTAEDAEAPSLAMMDLQFRDALNHTSKQRVTKRGSRRRRYNNRRRTHRRRSRRRGGNCPDRPQEEEELYTFRNYAHHNKYLRAHPNGHLDTVGHAQSWETWETAAGRNRNELSFQSEHGKFLVCEPSGAAFANRAHSQSWESFRIANPTFNDCLTAFMSVHNSFLCANSNGHIYCSNTFYTECIWYGDED